MLDELTLLFKALHFAADKHRDQRRKDAGATPYINHPIELAEVLSHEGHISDVNVLVAAVLHDTVEDTKTTQKELEDAFGDEIAAIVMEVTDDKSLVKEDRKRLQIENAATCSSQARLVKLADKICNLRDMSVRPPDGWSLERKRKYFDWSREVVSQLRGVNSNLEEIFDKVYATGP